MLTKADICRIAGDAHMAYALDKYQSFEFALAYGIEAAAREQAWQEAQAATLATVTTLVQQMLSALEDAFDDSNHVLAEYKQLYTERYRPQRLHAQEDVVKNCDLAINAARAFLSGATKESTDHV